jgi:hypothetical protein
LSGSLFEERYFLNPLCSIADHRRSDLRRQTPWFNKAAANTKTAVFKLQFSIQPIRKGSHELALGALGNVRTRTAWAWSEAEFVKLVSELP